MPQEIRLWKVESALPDSQQVEQLREIQQSSLDFEDRLENWLKDDIALLGMELLVLGSQVVTAYGHPMDLLCMDANGDLTVVELKRDRTPREVAAQTLDYASWVEELSHDDVAELAGTNLSEWNGLEEEFRAQFDTDLPDVLNEDHRMVVVASQLDSRTERIIRYLSESHGVPINAVNFQYFKSDGGQELLGRVFLIDPTEVERRTSTKGRSKRKQDLTREDLEAIADEQGIGELYRDAVEILSTVLSASSTTRSSLSFKTDWKGGKKAALGLFPGKGSPGRGLYFQIYTYRLADAFACSPSEIESALPDGAEDWQYQEAEGTDWEGHQGEFTSVSEARQLVRILTARASSED